MDFSLYMLRKNLIGGMAVKVFGARILKSAILSLMHESSSVVAGGSLFM